MQLCVVLVRERHQIKAARLRKIERLGDRERLVDEAVVGGDQVDPRGEPEQRPQREYRLDRPDATATDRDPAAPAGHGARRGRHRWVTPSAPRVHREATAAAARRCMAC